MRSAHSANLAHLILNQNVEGDGWQIFRKCLFCLFCIVLLLSVSLRNIKIIFLSLYLYISESKNRKDHIFLKFAHVTQMKHRQMRFRFCIMLMFFNLFRNYGDGKKMQ